MNSNYTINTSTAIRPVDPTNQSGSSFETESSFQYFSRLMYDQHLQISDGTETPPYSSISSETIVTALNNTLSDRVIASASNNLPHQGPSNGAPDTDTRCESTTKTYPLISIPSNPEVPSGSQFQTTDPFHCNICNTPFKKLHSLMRHNRFIHNEKRIASFQCDFCNKSFLSDIFLQRHLRGHTGEKPFQCDICDKRFSQSSNFLVHMRLHPGKTPFPCDLCNKSFTQQIGLNQHILRSHHWMKPRPCNI
ncbi:MAG: C2H2-type zinc finger protein [Endozoicomonadaceae bacterium]|nr:C2H2-type zinc finger protein [Endozoicomonadaceae bacterium]